MKEDDTTSFVVDFFDFSVRTSGFVQACAVKLGNSGKELDKIAAEGLYKTVIGMRRLGVKVIKDNTDIFLTSSSSLFTKYYLESSNEDGSISKSLVSPSHIYNSWANVCTAILFINGTLDSDSQSKFDRDMHFAVEGGCPGIIWYLNEALENDNLKWQAFVDKMLRRYWERIPIEDLKTT